MTDISGGLSSFEVQPLASLINVVWVHEPFIVLLQLYACRDRAISAGIRHPQTYAASGVAYCGVDSSTPGTYQVEFGIIRSNWREGSG